MAATIPAIIFFICFYSVIELWVDELTSRDELLRPAQCMY